MRDGASNTVRGPSEDGPGRLRGAAFATGVLGLLALSAWLRLRDLSGFHVQGDSVHPFHDALRLLDSGTPVSGRGTGFAYGPFQQRLLAPIVLASRSLRELFTASALLHAAIVLPVVLAGRRVGGPAAALLAGAAVAVHPLLVDLPHYGGHTYQAPLLVAFAVAAVVEARARPSPLALAGAALFLAAAIQVHPYALAAAIPALLLAPTWLRGQSPAAVMAAVVIGVLALVPMVDANLALLAEGRSGLTAGFDAARPPGFVAGAGYAMEARAWTCSGGPAAPFRLLVPFVLPALCLAGLVAPGARDRDERRSTRFVAAWVVLGTGALAGLARAIGYVQAYHFAVLTPVFAVAGAGALVGLLRLAGRALAAPLGRIGGRAARHARAGGLAIAVVAVLAALATWGVYAADALLLGTVTEGHARGCYASTTDPRPGGRRLNVVERVLDAIAADAGAAPRAVVTLAEDESRTRDALRTQNGSSMAYLLGQRLAGVPEALLDARHTAGEPWPRAYVVAELSLEVWERWDQTPTPPELARPAWPVETLLDGPTQPGAELRVLAFHDVWEGARWLRRGCRISEDRALVVEPAVDPFYVRSRGLRAEPVLLHWGAICTGPHERWWWKAP